MPTSRVWHPAQTAHRRGYLTVVVLATVATLVATLIVTADAAAQEVPTATTDALGQARSNIFGPFLDRTGFFRNATNNPGIVNRNNSFFDPALGPTARHA